MRTILPAWAISISLGMLLSPLVDDFICRAFKTDTHGKFRTFI